MSSTQKINPNDSAMPAASVVIAEDAYSTEFTAYTPGLTKREKLIFDLYVQSMGESEFSSDMRRAQMSIDRADILIAEMNKELK